MHHFTREDLKNIIFWLWPRLQLEHEHLWCAHRVSSGVARCVEGSVCMQTVGAHVQYKGNKLWLEVGMEVWGLKYD